MVDHVDGDWHNNSDANLVPSCQPCNGTRQVKVRDGEVFVVRSNGTRLRAVPRTCERCGGGFLVPPSALDHGKGRFCSRSCARKRP